MLVSSHKTHRRWVSRQRNVLIFRQLHLHVFSHEHPVRKGWVQDFLLRFEEEESAMRLASLLVRLGFSVALWRQIESIWWMNPHAESEMSM